MSKPHDKLPGGIPPDTTDTRQEGDALRRDTAPEPVDSAEDLTPEALYPEDIRPCPEDEDDHSTAEFDLNAEIDRKAFNSEQTSADAVADAAPEALYPEYIRPCPDDEDDHSDTDIDLDAEIEAKLGKMEEAPPLPEQNGAPADVAEPPLETAEAGPPEYYYPEDDRPCPDDEDDHSTADFDLNAEIEQQLGSAESAAVTSVAAAGLTAETLYPEYVRPCPEDEDDHSGADGGLVIAAATQSGSESEESTETSSLSPDLAAALGAPGYYDRDITAETSAAEDEDPDPEDDAPSLPEPESDGEDSDDQDKADEPSDALPDVYAEGAVAPVQAKEEDDDGEDDEEEDEGEEEEDDDEEDEEDRPMTLRDHLRDLRKRMFRAFLWMFAGFLGCYPFAEQISAWIFAPLRAAMPDSSSFIYTSPPEAFFTYMKIALVSGLFVASPMIFYQIWAFVAPGLYKEEKLYILPVAFFSAFFFIGGGAFCYFVVFPFAFDFFMSYNSDIIKAMPALSESLSFVLQLLIAFGLVFELPLFSFFLSRLGIITADMMRSFRRYAVLVMFIVAAILTPPDVISQMLMAGPLLLLYEISVLIAATFGKKKPKPENDEEEGVKGTPA